MRAASLGVQRTDSAYMVPMHFVLQLDSHVSHVRHTTADRAILGQKCGRT